MHYDYSNNKKYCEAMGLIWLGDNYQPLLDADEAAFALGFSQLHVETMMNHHLRQVKVLFTPEYYTWWGRIAVALYFLTGWKLVNKPKKREDNGLASHGGYQG